MKFVTINYLPRRCSLFGIEIEETVYFYGVFYWWREE